MAIPTLEPLLSSLGTFARQGRLFHRPFTERARHIKNGTIVVPNEPHVNELVCQVDGITDISDNVACCGTYYASTSPTWDDIPAVGVIGLATSEALRLIIAHDQ